MTERELLRMVEGLTRTDLSAWVRRGWVLPRRRGRTVVYREVDLARVRLIHEMRSDLRLDEEGIPVVLDLLDQVYGLRRELRRVLAAIDREPPGVKRRILERLR